jgi:hypothetical protein
LLKRFILEKAFVEMLRPLLVPLVEVPTGTAAACVWAIDCTKVAKFCNYSDICSTVMAAIAAAAHAEGKGTGGG